MDVVGFVLCRRLKVPTPAFGSGLTWAPGSGWGRAGGLIVSGLLIGVLEVWVGAHSVESQAWGAAGPGREWTC